MSKEHKYFLGKVDGVGTGKRDCAVYIYWELDEEKGRFTMSAETWNPRRTDVIECGQMVDRAASYFPGNKKAARMVEVWKRWHLNDMKAGCEHQRAAWDTGKQLTVTSYKWSPMFYKMRTDAEHGKLSVSEYEYFRTAYGYVSFCCFGFNAPKYPFPLVQECLDNGWIVPDKSETKAAGWVHHAEHPEGLLSKPCEVCGYRYGSAWLKEELPPEIIAEIKSWSEPAPEEAATDAAARS